MKKLKKIKVQKHYRDEEVSKLSYMMLKDVGICVRCLGNWAEKRHVLCEYCLEYNRLAAQRKTRQRRAELFVLPKSLKTMAKNLANGKGRSK